MAVARATRLIVGAWCTPTRALSRMQVFADGIPAADRYCTDAFDVYPEVIWPAAGMHVVSQCKDETYTIEGINADLRTYLGRLARQSRCFSRSIRALEEAMRLFVYHYNRRQRLINAKPAYRTRLPLLF